MSNQEGFQEHNKYATYTCEKHYTILRISYIIPTFSDVQRLVLKMSDLRKCKPLCFLNWCDKWNFNLRKYPKHQKGIHWLYASREKKKKPPFGQLLLHRENIAG